MAKKILVTAFLPFADAPQNASQLILENLPSSTDLETRILPVEYEKSFEQIRSDIDAGIFDFILLLGQAEGRTHISLERVAINLMDSSLADEGGRRADNEPIREDGPPAYLSTLPLKNWLSKCQVLGLPVVISNTAGLFVCNDIYYRTSDELRRRGSATPCLFVHFPLLEEQKSDSQWPKIPQAVGVKALQLLLECIREIP